MDVASLGRYDLCLDGGFLHRITNLQDRSIVFGKVRRVLRPNGVFVFMSMSAPIHRAVLHQRHPDRKLIDRVIYAPTAEHRLSDAARVIEGIEHLPIRFIGHWRYLLSELRKAGLRLMLFRLNHGSPDEPVSSLNVAALTR